MSIGPTLRTNIPTRTAIVRAHDRSNMRLRSAEARRSKPERFWPPTCVQVTGPDRLARVLRAHRPRGVREDAAMPSSRAADRRVRSSASDGAWGVRFPGLAGPGLPLNAAPTDWPEVAVEVRVDPNPEPHGQWDPDRACHPLRGGHQIEIRRDPWRWTSCWPGPPTRSASWRPI